MKMCEHAAATAAAAVTAAVLLSGSDQLLMAYCRVQQNGGLLSNHEVAQVRSHYASLHSPLITVAASCTIPAASAYASRLASRKAVCIRHRSAWV